MSYGFVPSLCPGLVLLGLLTVLGTGAAEVWGPGPWLLLDERNLLSIDHLQRVLGRPVRQGEGVSLRERPVQLVFQIRGGALFAFSVLP